MHYTDGDLLGKILNLTVFAPNFHLCNFDMTIVMSFINL